GKFFSQVPGRALQHKVLVAGKSSPAQICAEPSKAATLHKLFFRMRCVEDRRIERAIYVVGIVTVVTVASFGRPRSATGHIAYGSPLAIDLVVLFVVDVDGWDQPIRPSMAVSQRKIAAVCEPQISLNVDVIVPASGGPDPNV